MSRCCSLQNGLAAPEHRKWRRVHGLQLPLHPQQIAGWVALVLFAVASFSVLVPAFSTVFRPLLAAVLATLFLLHLAAHLTALLLDPADPELRRLRPASAAVPEFDRSKHAHVIENGRCHLCNIETSGPRTKHCSVCNKCVGKFDHHCKWLNHCIGGRNYAAFLVCVVSAVGACLVIVGVAVTELVLYHVDPSRLNPSWISDPPIHPKIFLSVVGTVGVLAAITAGLLLHLCLFHVYISVLGITTYEYIRNYRQLSSVRSKEKKCCEQQQQQQQQTHRKDTNNCSVETVEGTLRREHCFKDFDSRAQQNGLKSYPKVEVIAERQQKGRRVCHGCRYCRTKEPPQVRRSGSVCSRLCSSTTREVPSPPPVVPRRNQVQPTSSRSPPKRSTSLPALPPPTRRQMQAVSLKELGDVLAYVQHQNPNQRRTPARRYIRRKSIPTLRPTMSPTLSPIHESGLSNPGTPQPAPRPAPREGSWLTNQQRT